MNHQDPLIDAGFGRDFRLDQLPNNPTGKLMNDSKSKEDYEAYLGWLADYLSKNQVPVSARQQAYCHRLEKLTTKEAMTNIGMNAAIYEFHALPPEAFEALNEWNGTYIDFTEADVERIYNYALRLRQEAKEISDERTIDKDAIRQFLEEEKEKASISEEAQEFCDVPYRVLLAWVLKDATDPKDRIQLLDVFFSEYKELSRT